MNYTGCCRAEPEGKARGPPKQGEQTRVGGGGWSDGGEADDRGLGTGQLLGAAPGAGRCAAPPGFCRPRACQARHVGRHHLPHYPLRDQETYQLVVSRDIRNPSKFI